jgi:hypothetical protein
MWAQGLGTQLGRFDPTHGPAGPTISGLRSAIVFAPQFLIVLVISSAMTKVSAWSASHPKAGRSRLTLANPLHPFLPMCSVGVQERPAEADRLRAQRQSLDDVGAGADPAVDHDVDLGEQVWAERADLIQDIYRCWGADTSASHSCGHRQGHEGRGKEDLLVALPPTVV